MDRTGLFLVGAAPGRHPRHDPEWHALFPYPAGCAGARLMDLMGLTRREYISIPRRNVIPHWPGRNGSGDAFPMREARECAARMLPMLIGHNVLFVGLSVARAFKLEPYPVVTWHDCKAFNWAVLPHPSGRNRWYNGLGNKRATEEFLRPLAEAHCASLQPVVRHRARPC